MALSCVGVPVPLASRRPSPWYLGVSGCPSVASGPRPYCACMSLGAHHCGTVSGCHPRAVWAPPAACPCGTWVCLGAHPRGIWMALSAHPRGVWVSPGAHPRGVRAPLGAPCACSASAICWHPSCPGAHRNSHVPGPWGQLPSAVPRAHGRGGGGQHPDTPAPWYCGTLVAWHPGTLALWHPVPWYTSTIIGQSPGTMALWYPSAPGPWHHAPWHPGTLASQHPAIPELWYPTTMAPGTPVP